MSIKSWLSGQLTQVKGKALAWSELAEAIGEAVELYPEPYLERLKGRSSLFEHSDADLDVVQRELGELFAFGNVAPEDKPITLIQRQDEIHFKRTIQPLVNTLNREFQGMDVSWEPLYNHIDKPYCKEMRIKGEITGDEGDWWLTSRGVVRVNVSTLYGSQASLIDELEDKIARVVYPLLPLRIVSEGVLYILIYRIRERPETAFIDDVSIRHEMLEKWQEEDESVIPNGSYADVELAFPFSTVLYRMDSMRFDHYRLDTRVNQDVHEFARQSPSSATLEIGTNVKPIYYHMDSKPFDYHAIDYVPPRQFDVDSISHTDAAKQTLKVPDARDRMLGAEVESGEAPSVATEFALMSSLQDSEIEPIFTTPLRERSESIRVSAVLEGDGVAVMMASAEDRDLTTDDTIRQDSMSSDTWTPDREFPEQE